MRTNSLDMHPLKMLTVLIVEDEESISTFMQKILEEKVREIYKAPNGKKGIELFIRHNPDIMIVDVNMPDIDGIEMCEKIKKLQKKEVPIIMVSSFGKEEYFLRSIDLGVNRYLQKPVHSHDIEHALMETAMMLFHHQKMEQLRLRTYDVLDLLTPMVVLTDGETIKYANKAFLDFVSFKSFEEFTCHYACVQDLDTLIVKIDDHIIKDKNTWFEYLKEREGKSPVFFLHDVKENTSTAFLTHITRLPNMEEDYLVTFSNITELEQAKFELKKEAEYSELLKLIIQEKAQELYEQGQMMLQQSKLATMGEMMSAISHQWKQPLNAIRMLTHNLKDAFDHGELDQEKMDRVYHKINEQTEYMNTTVEDFRNFLMPEQKRNLINVVDNINDTLSIISPLMTANAIEIKFNEQTIAPDERERMTVYGFSNEFKQVLLNLLNNSSDAICKRKKNIDAMLFESAIEIRAELDHNLIRVIISDNGGGIPQSALAKIFDSYFTTKEEGSGIGLYMSKTIIESHFRGAIKAENIADGACFTITLPRSEV